MKPLTPEMKAEIQKKKDIATIHERIQNRTTTHSISRGPAKQVRFTLPEEFSGKDLKRAKKLISKRK